MVFRSSRTMSLDAGHGVIAAVARLQGTASPAAEVLDSEWLQVEALPLGSASPGNPATEPLPLTEQGLEEDGGFGRPRERASTLRNCTDCENTGELKEPAAKRTMTA